jgi:MFS family permease
MSSQAPTAPKSTGTWLSRWEPEDQAFWSAGGSAIAWRTLALTTVNLTLAFAAWFLVSALVVRLPQVGYTFTPSQLFWLTAMPGLAGGTLRLVHMFLTPMVGTRHVVSLSTLSLLVPLVGWFFAVQDPSVPYWVLLLLSFFAGLGGGNFSSFMPSTSLFFPKRLLGTALAIQAGIGNLGVSIVQFVTPWIIGVALLGGAAFMGDSQTLVKNGIESQVHLQNAAAVFIPFVVVFGITAWLLLKSVPVKANFAEQFDIFKSKQQLVDDLAVHDDFRRILRPGRDLPAAHQAGFRRLRRRSRSRCALPSGRSFPSSACRSRRTSVSTIPSSDFSSARRSSQVHSFASCSASGPTSMAGGSCSCWSCCRRPSRPGC